MSARLSRPRLDHLLALARSTRLTTVIAPAGYGKTTLLSGWAAESRGAWHTCGTGDLLGGLLTALRTALPALDFPLPATAGGSESPHALAGMLADAIAGANPSDLMILLDDVHLVEEPAARLLEALCRQLPAGVHLVLSSRQPPPFPVRRLRYDGELSEITAAQLAFTEEEIAQLFQARGEIAREVRQLTGGWPIAVRLAAEALRDPHQSVDSLRRPGPLLDYLADEIFDTEPPRVTELVRAAALFDRFTPGLLVALIGPDAAGILTNLVERGLFAEPLRASPGWFGLMPLVQWFVAGRFPLSGPRTHELNRIAAEWFTDNGHVADAIAAYARIGEHDWIQRLLAVHAGELGPDIVIATVAHVPPDRRDPLTLELAGDAYQQRGDWDTAMECFRRAATEAPQVARRIAWLHYFNGAPSEALATVWDADLSGADPVEESLLHSCAASAHWVKGDIESSRKAASTALDLARQAGDDRALGAAHTVLAMVAAAAGDDVEYSVHDVNALRHADRAGDLYGLIRIRANRAAIHVNKGRYAEALTELDVVIPLAELTGFVTYRALGLTNRGVARMRLGQLDEAAADFHAAEAIFAETGSWLGAVSTAMLGEVHRLRGERVLARVAYEEAIRRFEVSDTMAEHVYALAGLARLLVDDDPATAETLVRKALAYGEGLGHSAVLVAAAALALARGDHRGALDSIEAAEKTARNRGERMALAESIELRAQVTEQPALRLLDEAAGIWQNLGNPLGEIRVSVMRARLLGGLAGRQLAEAAETEAVRIGARALAAEAAGVARDCRLLGRPAIAVQTLGGFRLLRSGEPVAATAWQSRKARDLVKILVSRQGRPITREALIGLLWPDEAPEKAGNRLSVAMSTARAVLDPRRSGDECIVAEGDGVRLDLSAVSVDVVAFLADGQAGLLAWQSDRPSALPLLTAAEAAYRGDFLEEDPYEDWAAELRDRARLTYIQIAGTLAHHSYTSGDHIAASRYCLRILERDGYDETAHRTLIRALVAAGSHGEARRRYRTYVQRMTELDIEPRPFPS